ncbi:MAG: hypothetical protein RDU20_08830 [Desulfomonilaceae bacterium]|nr:hypothetical protein [Desulfomonilaceae bacterium]
MKGLVPGRVAGFVALVALSAAVILMGPISGHASFDVSRDAFSISNSPGWCFAMTAFARWYYLTRQDAPPLRKVLDKRSQQRIASELQGYYSKNLIKIQADYCNQYVRNQNEYFRRFVTGLVCGEPRIVLLMNKGPRGAVLHAVLAYAWIPEENSIKVYDPNYNNSERVIDLEKKEYTSLDITYNAICFPEVFHDHAALVSKMKQLHATFAAGSARTASATPVSADTPRITRVRSDSSIGKESIGIR